MVHLSSYPCGAPSTAGVLHSLPQAQIVAADGFMFVCLFNHGIIDTAQCQPLNHFRSVAQGHRVHCQYKYLPPPEPSTLNDGSHRV